MLLAIVVATTAKAQVPVITTQPNNASVCKGSTATFSVAASNSPIGYGWEYSNNGGETFVQINSNSVNGFQFSNFNTANIGVLNGTNGFMVRGYAYNASGGSQPSSVAMLTINTATDSLYIVKPNTTPTCVGNSFLLAGSQANGVFSSSNSNVASVNCSGMVSVKAQGTSSINYVYTAINGCSDTAKYLLNSNPPTPAIVSGATSVCVGANTTYTANVNNGVWTSNGRLTISATSGIATATSAGVTAVNYTLTGNNGCTTKTVFATTVNALPAVPTIAYAIGTTNPQTTSSGGQIRLCKNKTFTLVGTPSGGVWSSTGVAVANPITGLISIGSSTGNWGITYTISSGSCTNKRSFTGTVVSCSKGISNTNEQGITSPMFYPNPARGSISINIKTPSTVLFTDLYGKNIKQQVLNAGNNTLDISLLSKGVYLATVITNDTRQVQKIIVE